MFPRPAIIHYKGESTKKDNLDYVIMFNKAMYQFFDKHYSYAYSFLFKLIIKAGIVFAGNHVIRRVGFSGAWPEQRLI